MPRYCGDSRPVDGGRRRAGMNLQLPRSPGAGGCDSGRAASTRGTPFAPAATATFIAAGIGGLAGVEVK